MTRWTAQVEALERGRTRKVTLACADEPLSFAETLQLWQGERDFRAFFLALLAEAPFPAYFWETPPVTRTSVARPFEFVLVDSPALASATPDAAAFGKHFARADGSITTFWNLGRDALLVAPCPEADCPEAELDVYPHLAAFARGAPEEQQHALWRAVGAAVEAQLGEAPLWVSTSGLGVYWLHVRLDSWPKYVTFRPYREGA